jgi:selenide,water dikinase
MAVTGTVHPKRAITNAGARAGDLLVLTKPIGTGILSNALKKGSIDESQIAPAVRWMTTLNRAASLAMIAAGAHAATDITGFGLLGHGYELARASGVRLRIAAASVPIYQLARDLIAVGIAPGGSRKNASEHEAFTTFAAAVSADLRLLLSDAQTSGGLLIAVAPERHAELVANLREPDALACTIGRVEAGFGIVVDA